jgi:mRNA interferase YafQ
VGLCGRNIHYKLAIKRGLDITLLDMVIQTLLEEKPLDPKYKDHPLIGNYAGFRECHILGDWLLVYIIDKKQLILTASRTGTHSDLFGKNIKIEKR